MVTRPITLDELRHQLARAEEEYAAAEFIDDTMRMHKECARWAAEIDRLRAEIRRRGEMWSGMWKMSL